MNSNEKSAIIKENIFLIAFAIYIIQAFLRVTMFKSAIPHFSTILKLMKYVSVCLVLVKILMGSYTKKRILIFFVALSIFMFSTFVSSYGVLMELCIFLIGANGISLRKIVNIHFNICLVLLIITIISAKIGLIENLIYKRSGNVSRQAFGTIYPTDFAAHVFFIILSFIYLKGKKMKWYNYIIILVIAYLVHYFCDARLDTISIVLATIISFLYNKNIFIWKGKFSKFILIFSFIICAIFSIYFTSNYTTNNKFYIELNTLLSNRLQIGNMMLNEYGIKLFGQEINDHGYGGDTDFKYNEYNYIDSSYLRILLKYGLLVFIILAIANVYISKKIYDSKNYFLLVIMLLISVNSIVAQHYMDFQYNFLLLIYSARIENEDNKINQEEEYAKKEYSKKLFV